MAEYLQNGITDKEEMLAMYKLEKNEGLNTDQTIAISKLGKMIGGDPTKMKKKDRKDWKETIAEDAEKSGIKDTDKFVEDRFDEIHKLYKLKK